MFYEDDNEYIPLRIILLNVTGFYNIFKDNGKTMNFKLNDDSQEKIIDIFEHIGKELNIDFDHYLYESNEDVYFKAKVSDDTYFRKDKDKTINIIPREKTRYNCRIILQIQSVFYRSPLGSFVSQINMTFVSRIEASMSNYY